MNKTIYILSDGEYTNIGTTERLLPTLVDMQDGNARVIEVIYAEQMENADEVKKQLHKRLDDFRMAEEWFALTEARLKELVKELKRV